jgi:hypothetical protein
MGVFQPSYTTDAYCAGCLLDWLKGKLMNMSRMDGNGRMETELQLQSSWSFLPASGGLRIDNGEAVFLLAGRKSFLEHLAAKGPTYIETSNGSNLGITWDIGRMDPGKKLRGFLALPAKALTNKVRAAINGLHFDGFGTLKGGAWVVRQSFKSLFLVQVYNRDVGHTNSPFPDNPNHLIFHKSRITLGELKSHLEAVTGKTEKGEPDPSLV